MVHRYRIWEICMIAFQVKKALIFLVLTVLGWDNSINVDSSNKQNPKGSSSKLDWHKFLQSTISYEKSHKYWKGRDIVNNLVFIPRKSRSFTELNVEILAIFSLEVGDEVRNKFEENHLSIVWMKKQARIFRNSESNI